MFKPIDLINELSEQIRISVVLCLWSLRRLKCLFIAIGFQERILLCLESYPLPLGSLPDPWRICLECRSAFGDPLGYLNKNMPTVGIGACLSKGLCLISNGPNHEDGWITNRPFSTIGIKNFNDFFKIELKCLNPTKIPKFCNKLTSHFPKSNMNPTEKFSVKFRLIKFFVNFKPQKFFFDRKLIINSIIKRRRIKLGDF